jgi:hypothetical protein
MVCEKRKVLDVGTTRRRCERVGMQKKNLPIKSQFFLNDPGGQCQGSFVCFRLPAPSTAYKSWARTIKMADLILNLCDVVCRWRFVLTPLAFWRQFSFLMIGLLRFLILRTHRRAFPFHARLQRRRLFSFTVRVRYCGVQYKLPWGMSGRYVSSQHSVVFSIWLKSCAHICRCNTSLLGIVLESGLGNRTARLCVS